MQFVHSFPRFCAGKSTSDYIALAADYVESFIENGPFLVPEIINIPELEGSNETSEQFQVLQNRFCFTIFEEDKIVDHMKFFGPISVTFNYSSALSCGALPVFYFPKFKATAYSNDLGITLIHRLRVLLAFVQNYRALQDLSYEELVSVLGFQLTGKEHEKFGQLLATFDRFTKIDKTAYVNLEGTIQSLSELLYPTDRPDNYDNPYLEYFAQREWRLLGDLRLGGIDITEYIDAPTKRKLLNLNQHFFGRQMEFQNKRYIRVDLVQRLSPFYRKQFMKGITGLYVEKPYYRHIFDRLNRLLIDLPVEPVC